MTEAERADLISKITAAPGERADLLEKLQQFDATIADVLRRINALEKQVSADAVQPNPPELASWSPERLAKVIAGMSPAELDKLRQ